MVPDVVTTVATTEIRPYQLVTTNEPAKESSINDVIEVSTMPS